MPRKRAEGEAAQKDVHIRLEDDAYEALKLRAEREKRSVAWVAREIVERSLARSLAATAKAA
jgi:plasmid stability protein